MIELGYFRSFQIRSDNKKEMQSMWFDCICRPLRQGNCFRVMHIRTRMILLKRKPLCTTVLWYSGENLFLSPYSSSKSKLYCKHICNGKRHFAVNVMAKRLNFSCSKIFFSLSACILAGQHCPKYNLNNFLKLCYINK